MAIKENSKKFLLIKKIKSKNTLFILVIFALLTLSLLLIYKYSKINSEYQKIQNVSGQLSNQLSEVQSGKVSLEEILQKVNVEFEQLKNQDQVKINKELQEEINNINKTYSLAVVTYEDLLKLKESVKDTNKLDDLYTEALVYLSKRNYASASANLASLSQKIKDEQAKLAVSVAIPANVPENNAPPGSGYSRQKVTTDVGTFMVSIIAGELSTTKVIVDTASDGDCGNDCPVLPLATYVSRSGAYAAVNGSYFCPSTYPSCSDKKNSFDLLLMNKNKTYFNSSNNVYSNNPAVIFGGSYIRFVSAASEWGRDTGIDSMMSNYPLLVHNSNITFGGDDDPKKGSKGNRSFVANKGNTVYIGVVHSATVAESARALKTMGIENALNLDDGGSTALYSGGYKVGPGRDLPNAILFVRK